MGAGECEGGKLLKSVWWNEEVEAAVRRKEAAWKDVLAASDEEAKKIYGSIHRIKERLKGVYIRAKGK